jgi:hypothetical protein
MRRGGLPVDLFMREESGPKLARIVSELRRLEDGKVIQRELRTALRTGAQPALARGRQAARDLPAPRGHEAGLRADIARAMRIKVKLTGDPSVMISIPRKPLGRKGNLPRLMNRGSWRHPVFGRDVWVAESSRREWFDDVMRQTGPEVTREIERVVDRLERRLG